jgi:hypothetical protein
MHNQIDDAFNNTEHGAGSANGCGVSPRFGNSVLMAPTLGRAALGVTEGDDQPVQLLEYIEAMDYQPNTTARVMATDRGCV